MPGNQKPRSRKHRGTQTGSISRSQRSRPRNRQEAMAQARKGSGSKRAPVDRRDVPPTWSGSAKRGILFALLLLPISLLFGQEIGQAIVLTVIAAAFYIPLGYYTESFFYNRRQKKLAQERAAAQAAKGKG